MRKAYSPIEVADTSAMDEATWLQYRTRGIGGSDVAAVYGQSPFCTARDLYYVKTGVKPAVDEEDNWVAKEYGHLLEDLVARIFSRKTGLRVYQRQILFAHPEHPFMQANVDRFIEMPDGSEAILECKTSNHNCSHKWDDGAVPFNYELQVRHYMAVMNIDTAYIACLYGNNENEFVYRKIERDRDFEDAMIEQETYFWEHYVLAGAEPPYTEEGELVLASIRRYRGTADSGAPAVTLDPSLAASIRKWQAVREEKPAHDRESKRLDGEMKTVIVPVLDRLGRSCTGVCVENGTEYTVMFSPASRVSITAEAMVKLSENHPAIYAEYATKSESRRLSVRQRPVR